MAWHERNEEPGRRAHETSVDRHAARRRSRREHDETGGGPLGLGWGLGAFAVGALIGAALWRPAYGYGYGYPAYGYGYPAYGYGYGYPAYSYGYPAYGYGYGSPYGYGGGYYRAYYGYAYQPSRRVRRAVYRYR